MKNCLSAIDDTPPATREEMKFVEAGPNYLRRLRFFRRANEKKKDDSESMAELANNEFTQESKDSSDGSVVISTSQQQLADTASLVARLNTSSETRDGFSNKKRHGIDITTAGIGNSRNRRPNPYAEAQVRGLGNKSYKPQSKICV